MEGAHLKLVKDIPKTFQNIYFICGSQFGIIRSLSLHKSISDQQDGWGLSTLLDMKYATTLRQRIKSQSTSPNQSYVIESGTMIQTSSTPMKTQIKRQKSPKD